MSKSLQHALNGDAWSISSVIFDLNDIVDDEGRPLSERRADTETRVGVEMEMRPCPFEGIRHDKWMNVSALAQVNRYFYPALAEMASFMNQVDRESATWDDVLACVIDQLSGPARYLLLQHDSPAPVPAKIAVGHKLAAGFFGVLRGLHERLALGADIPVTVDAFLDLVNETGALVGASKEVCAGSPKMIGKACAALLEGTSDEHVEIEQLRLQLAYGLALQVQIGIFWRLYDRCHLWSLMRGEYRDRLLPRNSFLQQKLERTANELGAHEPAKPDGAALPGGLDAHMRNRLREALNDSTGREMLDEDIKAATELLNEPGSPIGFAGDIAPLALQVANYLHTYRTFEAELSELERELREYVKFPADAPIRLGAAAFPPPQALAWYEIILGRRLDTQGRLAGHSMKARDAI